MSEVQSGGWRKLTPAQLAQRGFSPASERRENPATGETISRRQYENQRLAARGLPKLSQMSNESYRARAAGFDSLTQARMIQSNEMYEAMERSYSKYAGGIPQRDIRAFRPIANEFNRQLAEVFKSGDWVIRPEPQYAKNGFGYTNAELTDNIKTLFEIIGWRGLDDMEQEQRVEYLRHY